MSILRPAILRFVLVTCCAGTALSFAAVSVAQELRLAREMTLADALTYAKAHQPQIRSALSRFRAQQAMADIPRSQWMPSAGIAAQAFAGSANNTTASYLGAGSIDLPRIGGTSAYSP